MVRRPLRPPTDPTRCYLWTLPVELLSGILCLVTQEDRDAPLTLLLVNKRLQTVVLGTQALWSTIDILDPPDRIRKHLERSAPGPLAIRTWAGSVAEDHCAALQELVELITPHGDRVQKIQATFHPIFWHPIIVLIFKSARSLNQLHVKLVDRDPRNSKGAFQLSPYGAHIWEMKDLSLTGLKIEDTKSAADIPTKRLRLAGSLELSWDAFSIILSKTKELRYLELSNA